MEVEAVRGSWRIHMASLEALRRTQQSPVVGSVSYWFLTSSQRQYGVTVFGATVTEVAHRRPKRGLAKGVSDFSS